MRRRTTPTVAAGSTVPTLESGLTCLAVDRPRSAAVVDLALGALGPNARAYWVDVRSVADTYRLYDRAASERCLSGLRIARAFTAYQHFSLTRALLTRVDRHTRLVCLPNLTALYRDDDVPDHERDRYLDAVVTGLGQLATATDVPILVSVARDDELAARVRSASERVLTADETAFGIRYDGDAVETTVYRDGTHLQTTIPYWVDLYGTAAEQSLIETAVATEFAGVA